jgi:hypothetical protein
MKREAEASLMSLSARIETLSSGFRRYAVTVDTAVCILRLR